MAKPKAAIPAEPAGDLEVAFNFAAGELRTAEIKLPGRKAFSFTFRVPGAGAAADMMLADLALAASGGSDDEKASRGEAMVRFVAKHLVGWTIPRPATWPKDDAWPNFKAVDALDDALVIFALYMEIRKARADAKN